MPGPLQNRVLPSGAIVADPARGLLMGNRGCLRRPDRTLGTSRWRSKLWISCVLDWRGRRRDVMPPGSWTALFFLDEATALAAGHRSCGYCRRADHLWFARSWQAAAGLPDRPRAVELDAWLHAERVDSRTRRQLTRTVAAGRLPDGAMVRQAGVPALVNQQALLPWSLDGYGPPTTVEPGTPLELLTPPTALRALSVHQA